MSPDFNRYRPPLIRDSDPAAIVERLYMLAEALKVADKIAAEVWQALPIERESAVEAALSEPCPTYSVDFANLTKKLTAYADAWQDELDGEIAA